MPVSKLATKYMFQNWGAVRWNSRQGTPITTIVVHHQASTNFDSMPSVWVNREASAHYGISPTGAIRAYVDEDNRAWHCGYGNSYSIGIECTNTTGAPNWGVSDATVTALVSLIQEIQSRRGKLNIVGHRDVPQNSTACPGPSLYPRLQEIRNRVNGTAVKPPVAPPAKPPVGGGYKVEPWNVRQVVDVDALNVRTAQNTKGAVVKTLKKGQTFNATRVCRNGENVNGYTTWFEVDGSGWASGAYVTPVKNAPAPKPPTNTGKWIAENGTFIPNQQLPLTVNATGSGALIANIPSGSAIKYDAYMIDSKYVWIRQPRSGGYGYMATGNAKNGKRVDYWGTFK